MPHNHFRGFDADAFQATIARLTDVAVRAMVTAARAAVLKEVRSILREPLRLSRPLKRRPAPKKPPPRPAPKPRPAPRVIGPRPVPAAVPAPKRRGAKRSPAQLAQTAEACYAVIARRPRVIPEEIAADLGLTARDIAVPLRQLVAQRRVTTSGQKRFTYYVASPDEGPTTEAPAPSLSASVG